MTELPFLVVHGALVSKILVLAGAALGVAAMWLLALRRERERLRWQRATRGAVLRSLAPGTATIIGTLRGRAATASSSLGKVIRTRSDELVLEVEGTPVALRGDVEVTAGSRARASWRRLPAGFVETREQGSVEPGAWRAAEVREGDRVIAHGKLTQSAGDAGGDYRASAGVWKLEPLIDVPVIDLFAERPATTLPALHPRRVAIVGGLFAVMTYAALWATGAGLLSLQRMSSSHCKSLPSELVIASALPHVRQAALEAIDQTLLTRMPRTDETIAQRLALGDLRGGCVVRAQLELDEQRFDDAVATERRCDAHDLQVRGLALLGRYDEAHALVPEDRWITPRSMAVVGIATGDWKLAVHAADLQLSLIHRHSSRDSTSDETRNRCLAIWFHAKAGDPHAEIPAADATNPTCEVVRVMLLPRDQRAAALHAAIARAPLHTDRISSLMQDLAWAYGDLSVADFPDDENQLTGGEPWSTRDWLEPLAAASRDANAVDRWTVMAEDAARSTIFGDFAHADVSILAADEAAPPGLRNQLVGLRLAIGLHTPTPMANDLEGQPSTIAKLAMLRAGKMPQDLDATTYDNIKLDGALSQSLAGDAAQLAYALEQDHPMWEADAGPVLAILPRLTMHRERIVAALRNFHSGLATDLDHAPFAIVTEAAMRRDLARLAGDSAAADRWQQLVTAQRHVLDDPEKVIALLLWQAQN